MITFDEDKQRCNISGSIFQTKHLQGSPFLCLKAAGKSAIILISSQ